MIGGSVWTRRALAVTGVFGLVSMLIFALVLVVALVYDYRKGALEWD